MSVTMCQEPEEDYLNPMGLVGTITSANYSEYTPAFAEFMTIGPQGRNLSAYPEHLRDFLDQPVINMTVNYSLYAQYLPAFVDFMLIGPQERNLSAYPEHLRDFLDQPMSNESVNYSIYASTFEEFMADEWEPRDFEQENYPVWMVLFFEDLIIKLFL